MNAAKKTGIVIGFYLAICIASLATSGLAWFITTRQASVNFSRIKIGGDNGQLILELQEEENSTETIAVNNPAQTEYAMNDPVVGDMGGGRKIRYVDVYGSPSGLAFVPRRAPGDLILRIPENDGSGNQDYFFDAYDSDHDGNEDGVIFNKALPAGATSIELHYTFDLNAAYSTTKSMNINQYSSEHAPVETEDTLTIYPEAISDISSGGEEFYRNVLSPDQASVVGIQDLTGIEKIYGSSPIGSYVQFTFWVINELPENSIPVDLAISKIDENQDLLSVVDDQSNSDEHYRMAILDTTDPENPDLVFFYEQKDWDSNDRYVDSTNIVNSGNTFSSIASEEIVDGSEFQVVKSYVEGGTVPIPGNQLLYSRLSGGEHCSLTVRIWCEGTLCDNFDIGQVCNANFNIVGYDHV